MSAAFRAMRSRSNDKAVKCANPSENGARARAARRASAGPTPQWGKRGGVGKLECFVRVLVRRVSRDEAH